MEINLKGKRALVTGAGRGIGRECVKQLLKANAKVIALSKTDANLQSLKSECPSIETVCCDLNNWDETTQKVSSLGPIDLLINNAAYAELTKFGSIDEEVIDKHFNINIKAIINVTQIVVKGMRERKYGSIVNVSSIAGLIALEDHLVYSATKAAVDEMTRTLALELGPYQIRVNSVNPTVVWTEMSKVGWSDPTKRNALTAKTPLGRFCDPEDVTNVILYLLSDLSSMVTGTCLPIDGGLTAC